MTSSNMDKDKDLAARLGRQKKNTRRLLLLMALAILLLALFQWRLSVYKHEQLAIRQRADSVASADSLRMADSLARLRLLGGADSVRIADSLFRVDSLRHADSLRKADSAALANRRGRVVGSFDTLADVARKAEKQRQDSLRSLARTDSLRKADSLKNLEALATKRAADPNPPSPVLVPPPGRYYQEIQLRVQCGEPKCRSEISLGDSTHAQKGDVPVAYNRTGVVYYRATDSLGNATPWLVGKYDMASDNKCGSNAYPVPVKGKQVCVDAYEYPNKPDQRPRDMVTQEMASRLCQEAGKRLCSVDEWQAACRGKDNARYPYGNNYNPSRCVTAASEPLRSGRAEQCRSWWGMYDMSGNLWEWTSTPSPQRSNLFLVAGGAWNTQNGSQCGETKFSFYPQNEYTFVGFRCCAD